MLHQLIDVIYEAAREPSRWRASLDHLRTYLHARSAILLYRNHRLPTAGPTVSSGIAAEPLPGCDAPPWLEAHGEARFA